jgi:DNA-binding CsgD family transcriptional regulator
VAVAPLAARAAGSFFGARPAAVLIITDPEEVIELPEGRVQRLFGLTPSEARIATRIAAGESIAEIAAENAVSKNTVRSQVQSVFAKMDVNRQSELVRLLGRLLFSATPNPRGGMNKKDR